MPPAVEALTVEAAFRMLAVHLEDVAGAPLDFETSFLLLFKKLTKGKVVSGFFGPAQLWSGPNRCFKQ